MSRIPLPRTSSSQNSLHTRDLSVGLKEYFGIDLNEADLSKPLQVMHFLSVCLHVTERISYEQIKSSAREVAPENNSLFPLSVEALEQIALEKFLRKSLREIGYTDFSMRDLQKPEPNRIKRILYHFVNFADLGQPALRVKKDCENKMNQSIQHKLELEEKIVHLSQFIKDTTAQQKEEDSTAKKYNEENNKLAQENGTLRKTVHASDTALDEIRKKKNELDKLVEGKALEVKVAKEDVELCKQCIIEDPQKMRTTMASLRNKANVAVGQLISTKDKMRANSARAEQLTAISPDIENSINILNECKKTRKATADTKRNLPALEDTLEKKKTELQSKLRIIKELEKKLSNQWEKQQKLESIQEKQRQKLYDRLEVNKQEYEEWTNRTDATMKLNEYKEKYLNLVQKNQETVQKTEKDISALLRLFNDAKQIVEQYILGLAKAVNLSAH